MPRTPFNDLGPAARVANINEAPFTQVVLQKVFAPHLQKAAAEWSGK